MKEIMFKNTAISIYVVILLAFPVCAEYLSVGTRSGDDYQSNSVSYRHTFNDDWSMGLSYSADGLEDNFNSLQLSVDRYFANSSLSLSAGSDYSKDYSRTNTIGLDYSITFKASDESTAADPTAGQEALSSSEDLQVTDDTEVSENVDIEGGQTSQEQFFVPRASAGARFSKTSYLAQKLEEGSTNLSAGLGTSIGSLFDISGVWNGYSYRNEAAVKEATPGRLARNLVLQDLSSSPKSSLDGTFTYYMTDMVQLYYGANTTIDLLGERADSRTVGITLYFFDSLSIDLNNELTDRDTSYSSVTCGYSF